MKIVHNSFFKSIAFGFTSLIFFSEYFQIQVGSITEKLVVLDHTIGQYLSLLPVARAHDQGLISYFEKACPQGWIDHPKSSGRFLLGTSFDYETEQEGGKTEHVLTTQQMPAHQHFMFTTTGNVEGINTNTQSFYSRSDAGQANYIIQGTASQATHGMLSNAGSNQAFSTVPPHIKLKICEKVSINANQVDLSDLKLNIHLHIQQYNATFAHYESILAEYKYLSQQYDEKRKEFDSLKKYSPALHILGIVALVFVVINIVFWVINFSKYSKAQKLINEIKADDANRAIDSER